MQGINTCSELNKYLGKFQKGCWTEVAIGIEERIRAFLNMTGLAAIDRSGEES